MKSKITIITIVCFILLLALKVWAVPVGPTVTLISNTTKGIDAAAEANHSGSGNTAGGYIFTTNLNSEQQNPRWKAYVGNVTGTLVLDDADGFSIYDWSITASLTGEVYASRSSSVTWGNIACATAANITAEEIAMNHTSNPNDNISTTFDGTDNDAFDVGTTSITANTCSTTNLFVNGSAPPTDVFEEVLLHDESSMVYTSIIESDIQGYNTNGTGATYDFQLIIPEVGLASWASSTAYYFYVELT